MFQADYWKSQARKFCDFCKCWIADNKPSIQFHENGKRHKENVAQKLSLLTKRSVKEKKESLQVDEEMRKMEEAAMKAYMKDMESNPDYTSHLIIDKVEQRKQTATVSQTEQKAETKEQPPIPDGDDTEESAEENKQWYEAQSDEGYTYYWNYATSESVWEPPKEGFVSIAEQQSEKEPENPCKESNASDVDTAEKDVEQDRLSDDDSKTEKDKIVDDSPESEGDETGGIGPATKPDPYGKWSMVNNRIPPPVDLQLPQQEYVEIKVPSVMEPEQPHVKFKEKTITRLNTDDVDGGDGGPSTFKKRKFSAARGNMRRKFDDDDDD